MSLANLKPEVQRALAIAVPVLVALLAAILIVPKVVGIASTNRLAYTRQREAEAAVRQNAVEVSQQLKQQLAAWPQTRDEQLAFLKDLNRIVSASGVRLVNYQPPATASGNNSGGSGALVKPLATEVTVSGSYRDMVGLFNSLAGARRLFAVENLQLRTEGYPRLSASFRLIRYVVPSDLMAPGGQLASGSGVGD
jgi:Tfp pilus assembly protein PilO